MKLNQSGNKVRHWLVIAIKLAVVFIAIRYLFVSDRLKLGQLTIRSGGWGWIIGASFCCIGLTLISLFRYWILLRAADVFVSLFSVVRIGFISWVCNATFLGGFGAVTGDGMKMLLLSRESDNRAGIVSATIIDRALGFLAMVLLAMVAISNLDKFAAHESARELQLYKHGFASVGISIVVAFVMFLKGWRGALLTWMGILIGWLLFGHGWSAPSNVKLIFVIVPLLLASLIPLFQENGVLFRLLERIPFVGNRFTQLVLVASGYRQRIPEIVICFLVSIAVQIAAVTVVYLVSKGMDVEATPSFGEVAGAALPVFALSVIPLPASGLGIGEAAFDTLLRLFSGMDSTIVSGGAAIFLGFRIIMTVTALSGIPFLLASGRGILKELNELIQKQDAKAGKR